MKLKTAWWVAGVTILVSAAILAASRIGDELYPRCFTQRQKPPPAPRIWVWVGPNGPYGLGEFYEELSKNRVSDEPAFFPVTYVTLGRIECGFYMPAYRFVLVAGLPILAAVNVMFSLYRRHLGSLRNPDNIPHVVT